MRVRSFLPAATIVLALSTCTTQVPANDLAVGDCVEDDAAFSGEEGVQEVPTIDCEEPHLFEVFALVDYPDADEYPGEDTVRGESRDLCFDEVEGYVGAPPEQVTEYTLQAVYPSQETWDAGDRIVICLLQSAEPVEGSAKDSGASGDESEG